MKKLICILLAAVLLTGCAAGSDGSAADGGTGEPAAAEGYTFTDDLDRSVTVCDPKNVAVLLGSFADVWYLAGGELAAAPEDAWEDFDLPLSESAVNLGKINDLSLEMLFSASPDLVIASPNIRVDLEWLETLESAGIPVAYFDVSDFADYLHMLDICTDITGRKDLYKTNGTDIQSQIDKVLNESAERVAQSGAPAVLSLRASSASVRAKNSSGNVLGEMLKALGCVNIADSESSLLENLSMEYIIKS
ncbi:MAG: ABC transporter substrate-binding protein, partial [Oscillospiraceae bacterium]|nr:ABC transporter substrate-binding protein [Oscillospiraceae bacterium]